MVKMEQDCTVNESTPHLVNIGRMIEVTVTFFFPGYRRKSFHVACSLVRVDYLCRDSVLKASVLHTRPSDAVFCDA